MLARISAWRIVGGLSYAASGACFVAGLGLLYEAEGPGRADVRYQLAQPAGQALFAQCTAALVAAVGLAAVAAVSLHFRLRHRSPYASMLAAVLTVMAGTFSFAVLSLQYGLMSVGQEGIAPTETAFHALAVFEHGAADLGGYTSFALLAASTLCTSTVLLARRVWRSAAVAGVLAAGTLPVLYFLDASYAFMLPFGLWEMLLAGCILLAGRALDQFSGPTPRS